MNQSQIHLALTHLPVVLTLTGLILLIISLLRKNQVVTKTSFYILFAAAIFALPVFFTGEGAEDIVKNLPGVSESIIERHEVIAQISLYFIIATGLAALAGLFTISGKSLLKTLRYFVLLAGVASSVLLAYTAHLGGQIRHTEIRAAFVDNGRENQMSNTNNDEANKEDD